LFKVPIEGATNYKWSTGDEGAMLDSLRVFKEDKYAVTVTVDKDVCFMLCDTSTLARYDKPTAFAGVELGSFCQTNAIRINSGFNPGHPDITAIVWSNGEKDKLSINVTTAGTYTVAYTDGCGEIATATVNTGQLPVKITKAEITPKVDYDCITGFFKGSLEASGNSTTSGPFGLGVEKFLWSNGGTNRTINIDQDFEGSFTVTVTDGCGTTATATYELKAQGKNELNPSIFIDKTKLCETSFIRLNVFNERNGRLAYKWSTGEETPFLDTKTAGVFTVTVTDLCKNTKTAQITVSDDELSPSPLTYAKVFFPDGMAQILNTDTTELDLKQIDALKLNRTFGPIVKAEMCPQLIQDYEFFVFNRWGQKVFESTNIVDEWDGRQDGEDRHLSDTFVWVARYKIFGIEKTIKGDVNLLR
jgi:CHU_C Type IX secretion signal domain